jgi:hypothetical protein
MALPPSLADLLVGERFPQRWDATFAPRQWCRLPGFADRLKKLRVPYRGNGTDCPIFHRQCVKQMRDDAFRKAAAKKVPEGWRDEFPNLAWDEHIGEKAFLNLLHGSVTPVPLDRAAHAIVVIEALLTYHGRANGIDLAKHVRIAPAIYQLGGFDMERIFSKTSSGRESFAALQKLMNNFDDEFYFDVADGHCMTLPTATAMRKAMMQLFPGFAGEVRVLPEPQRRVNGANVASDAPRPARKEVLSF